jgi:GNAT superfamily N-acetyltransferase
MSTTHQEETAMLIREYRPEDERGWLRCRVLSFLDTAFFDNVLRRKETYENPSIELVAEEDGQIVGLIDIEVDTDRNKICYNQLRPSAMIWHIAVHPDHQRKGIARALLNEAERMVREAELTRLEAWTRDDDHVRQWYLKNGFSPGYSYLHVFLDGKDEVNGSVSSQLEKFTVISCFAHYTGPDRELVRKRFERVHECTMYEKQFDH